MVMRTERPASSAARPPRLVRSSRSPRQTMALTPQTKRSGPCGSLPRLSRIDATGFGGVFIEPDEVAQCDRIGHLVRLGERIAAQCFFETSHEDRDAKRIEPRIEQYQVIRQRRQTLLVILCNLLNLGDH